MKMRKIMFLITMAALLAVTQAQAVMFFARPYEPNLQRWLTRDPIGEDGGINLYGYVRNDPVDFIDPFGEKLYPPNFIGPLLPTDWRATVFKGFENPRFQQHDQLVHDV